jgi:TonB family protein
MFSTEDHPVAAVAQEWNVSATRMRRTLVVGLVVGLIAWLILAPASVRAQETLAHAKDLYLSAAYDEALAVLEQLKALPAPSTEVQQYRMFCLLALQRSDEARKAIEDIVTADPFYRPSETQTSPRILLVFQDTRKAMLPGLVQRTYADAKSLFEKKDPQALSQFELVLKLLDDPDLKNAAQLADMRTVVSGFRDLSKAMASVSAPPAAPRPVEATPARSADVGATQTATIVETPPATSAPDGAFGFTPPVVVAQPIPRWDPPRSVDRRSAFKGQIEVTIDQNGNVTSATIQQSVHPLYDPKLLAMARTWKYKPALRNGLPTTSTKVVAIQLQPSK